MFVYHVNLSINHMDMYTFQDRNLDASHLLSLGHAFDCCQTNKKHNSVLTESW